MSRIHSGGFPTRHAALLAETLRDVDHMANSTAQRAAADDQCEVFIGPWRSHDAAQVAPVLREAGIAQICPAATWDGVDGVIRLVPPDSVVCAALVANAPEPLAVVAEHEDYGRLLAGLLREAGLEEKPGAEAFVYCGVARNAPHGLFNGRRVYAFDGAQGFGDAHTRYLLPAVPREDWTDAEVLDLLPQVRDAGELAIRGDWDVPVPRRCGVWRPEGRGFSCVAVWEAP